MVLRIVCARPAHGPLRPFGRWGKVMQRLTISKRLLVVALLPALGLLARDSFGAGGTGDAASFWTVFSVAMSVFSIGLALLSAGPWRCRFGRRRMPLSRWLNLRNGPMGAARSPAWAPSPMR